MIARSTVSRHIENQLGRLVLAHPTRRRFMQAITGATVASGVPEWAQAAMRTDSVFTASAFRRAMLTDFRAKPLSPLQPVAAMLRLSEVRLPNAGANANGASTSDSVFSLRFDLASADWGAYRQDTYWLSHATLGDFAVLLVPTGNGRSLRAEFNRT